MGGVLALSESGETLAGVLWLRFSDRTRTGPVGAAVCICLPTIAINHQKILAVTKPVDQLFLGQPTEQDSLSYTHCRVVEQSSGAGTALRKAAAAAVNAAATHCSLAPKRTRTRPLTRVPPH